MNTDATKKIVLYTQIAVVAVVLVLLFFNSMYTVSEQQQAVVLQFGRAISTQGAGLHYKIPFVQNIRLVDITTKGMEFGYQNNSDYTQTVESESLMITNDFNFVNVDFYVEYKVSDPVKYLYMSRDPEGLLKNILQSEARSVVSAYNVDDVLTTAKSEIQTKVRDGVLFKVNQYDLGLMISNITIQDTEPPTEEVIAAFKNVENAKQNKDTEINNARTYYNEELPQARADADKIVKEAEAIKESRINESKGQVARFNEMYTEYSRNKEITRSRMYLETMEKILPDLKVYIDGGSSGQTLKILQLEEGEATNEE